MWHEARKQEKKIRGIMVDYKRRAERRRDYYERIKQDPAQFLQVHGRPAKIHLDPAIAIAAEGPATMMPWQGDTNNMIDRFDVRAHLDIIPEYKPTIDLPKLSGEELIDDRKACYERYRTLVQNDFLGMNEDKFLHQIYVEERFGPVIKPAGEEEKKKLMDKKAAIGYVYEDSTEPPLLPVQNSKISEDYDEDEEKDDLSDIDLDLNVDVSVLTDAQCAEMNEQSVKYGMVDGDFITYLMQDKDEADQLRLAKEIEEEKAMFSGRKSRRERRALREKKLAGRKITSPPSYAARESPVYTPMRHSTSKSRSRSRSPPNAGKKMFITSFGDKDSDGEIGHPERKSSEKDVKGSDAKRHNSRFDKSSICENIVQSVLKDETAFKKKSKNGSLVKRHSSAASSSRAASQETREGKNEKYALSSRSCSSKSSRKRRRSSSSSSSSSCSQKRHSKRRGSRSRSSSRSQSESSRSRSRSQSYSARTRSRSRSRSRSVKKSDSPQLPPPPVKSYYRHSLSRSSSDILDDSDSQDRKEDSSSGKNNSLTNKWQQLTGKAGPITKSKLKPQERLKRRTQMALNRQYKADKKAEMEKSEKQLQERMDRAEELREMAIRLRQRERERRHRLRGFGEDSESDAGFSKECVFNDDDDDYRHQSSKDHREYGRSRHYSSSEDERSAKPSNNKFHHGRRSISPPKSLLKSPPREHKRSSPVRSYRKVETSRGSRKSPVRNNSRRSPPKVWENEKRRNFQSRNRDYDRVRPYGSQKYRTRSPERRPMNHSQYRKNRHSNSRSPSRSIYSTNRST